MKFFKKSNDELNGTSALVKMDSCEQLLTFYRYKWDIWGFSFSFMDVFVYIAVGELILAFIMQLFGQIPHALGMGSEQNYNGSGINNGKAGSHKYSNKKG